MKKLLIIGAIFCCLMLLFKVGEQDASFLGLLPITKEELQEELKEMVEVEDTLYTQVIFEKTNLLYDAKTDCYFITIGETERGNFLVNSNLKMYWMTDDIQGEAEEKILQNEAFPMVIISGNQYEYINLKISTLPLLHFTGEAMPQVIEGNNPPEWGHMTVVDPLNEYNGRYTAETYSLRFSARGATSLEFPKKSYSLNLLDEFGAPRDVSLLGMREDDDWNLSSMYGDKSKVREAVVLEALNQMAIAKKDNELHPQDVKFCEVFLNDEYAGVYELLEAVDAKLIDLDRENDIGHKAGNSDKSGMRLVYYPEGKEEVADQLIDEYFGIVGYSSEEYLKGIDYLEKDLMTGTYVEKTYEELSEMMNMENLVDVSIAKMIFLLTDNDVKNTYYVGTLQKDDSYKMRRELFDFNYALGDIWGWNEAKPDFTVPLEMEKLRVDPGYFPVDLMYDEKCQEFRELYIQRYEEWREEILSEENIKKIIDEKFLQIYKSGSYFRDMELWDDNVDLELEYNRLHAVIEAQLELSDQFIERLKEEHAGF